MFSELQTMSGRLSDGAGPEDAPRGDLDGDIRAVVAALDTGSASLGAFLTRLDAEARTFETDLTRARQDFAKTAAANLDLLDASDILDRVHDDGAPPRDPAAALAWIDAAVGASYTMAREREIHAEILGRR